MTFWNVFDPTNSSPRWPHYPLIQATFKDDSELTFKMLWQQWFGGFKGRTKCHPYLKPLARLRNIWRRAYSRPRTGTCRRQPASAWTRTALHPPRGFCPVKRREGKWTIIARSAKVASLATLNYCTWLWYACFFFPVGQKQFFEGGLRIGAHSYVGSDNNYFDSFRPEPQIIFLQQCCSLQSPPL